MSRTKEINFTCPFCQTPNKFNWDISLKTDGTMLTYCTECSEAIAIYGHWEPVVEIYTLTPAESIVSVK